MKCFSVFSLAFEEVRFRFERLNDSNKVSMSSMKVEVKMFLCSCVHDDLRGIKEQLKRILANRIPVRIYMACKGKKKREHERHETCMTWIYVCVCVFGI